MPLRKLPRRTTTPARLPPGTTAGVGLSGSRRLARQQVQHEAIQRLRVAAGNDKPRDENAANEGSSFVLVKQSAHAFQVACNESANEGSGGSRCFYLCFILSHVYPN